MTELHTAPARPALSCLCGIFYLKIRIPDKKKSFCNSDYVYICIKNIFTFYNRCRNVSGWIDSDELDITLFRKAKSKNKQSKQINSAHLVRNTTSCPSLCRAYLHHHGEHNPCLEPYEQGGAEVQGSRQLPQPLLPSGGTGFWGEH